MSNSPENTAPETYLIPACRMADLEKKVDRLNRRAARLGMSPIGIETVRTVSSKPDSWGRVLVSHEIKLTGEAPVVAGHTFIARIQHTSTGNIISKAPGAARSVEVPVEMRDGEATCDHCGTNRRRNDTFVLRTDETGGLIRVGRNCLADYLRTPDAAGAISIFTFLYALSSDFASMDFMGGEGGSGFDGYGTVETVAAAISCIRKCGWVSAAKAREEDRDSTKSVVVFAMNPPPIRPEIREEWEALRPVAEDYTAAATMVEWAKALDGASDYEHNLKVALSAGYVDPRNVGLAVSVVSVYRRAMEKAEAVKAPSRPDSGYFGTLGTRYTLQGLTVKATRYCETAYGVSTLVVFEDAEGHTFKWFASGSHEFEAGSTVNIKGTVKKHGEYKGRKETMLTRCAVL